MTDYVQRNKQADARARFIARLIEVDGMTQTKVSKILGVSKVRVGQIYKKHLRKINNPKTRYGHSIYLKKDVFLEFKSHYDDVMEKGE